MYVHYGVVVLATADRVTKKWIFAENTLRLLLQPER